MKLQHNRGAVLVLLVLLCFGSAWAQQKAAGRGGTGEPGLQVDMKGLPPAVQKTVAAESKRATIRALSRQTEGGKTLYRLETTVHDRTRDLLIDSSGAVVELREELRLRSLPVAAQDEVKKSLRGAKLVRLESITRGGTLQGYSALVEKGGQRTQVLLGPRGRPLPKETK